MKDRILIGIILFATFAVAFIAVTALTDTLCRRNGYYDIGRQAEVGLYE